MIASDNVDKLLGVELEVRFFSLPLTKTPSAYGTSRSSSSRSTPPRSTSGHCGHWDGARS
ncbi:hypothetical protein FIBSPDRAFT_868659 [Athelia psychrophila]|uniref:Uncharacterized protein n=1 Tax=Athelia psychrophila TaxID=1759441 RepID=A0A166CW51_9AGAM|nr:hypothetical protein FIBSPDRAFT_868659 [Fibularhizoctonia sp. CBS 109695]